MTVLRVVRGKRGEQGFRRVARYGDRAAGDVYLFGVCFGLPLRLGLLLRRPAALRILDVGLVQYPCPADGLPQVRRRAGAAGSVEAVISWPEGAPRQGQGTYAGVEDAK